SASPLNRSTRSSASVLRIEGDQVALFLALRVSFAIEQRCDRDNNRGRSLDRLVGNRAQALQGGDRVAHDPAEALCQRHQLLAEAGDVLLDSQAPNTTAIVAVAVPE